jgi:hypothetical protein
VRGVTVKMGMGLRVAVRVNVGGGVNVNVGDAGVKVASGVSDAGREVLDDAF